LDEVFDKLLVVGDVRSWGDEEGRKKKEEEVFIPQGSKFTGNSRKYREAHVNGTEVCSYLGVLEGSPHFSTSPLQLFTPKLHSNCNGY
jgi:hypothetical protein